MCNKERKKESSGRGRRERVKKQTMRNKEEKDAGEMSRRDGERTLDRSHPHLRAAPRSMLFSFLTLFPMSSMRQWVRTENWLRSSCVGRHW